MFSWSKCWSCSPSCLKQLNWCQIALRSNKLLLKNGMHSNKEPYLYSCFSLGKHCNSRGVSLLIRIQKSNIKSILSVFSDLLWSGVIYLHYILTVQSRRWIMCTWSQWCWDWLVDSRTRKRNVACSHLLRNMCKI